MLVPFPNRMPLDVKGAPNATFPLASGSVHVLAAVAAEANVPGPGLSKSVPALYVLTPVIVSAKFNSDSVPALFGNVAVPPPPPVSKVPPMLKLLGQSKLSLGFLDKHTSALLALFLQQCESPDASLVAPLDAGFVAELTKALDTVVDEPVSTPEKVAATPVVVPVTAKLLFTDTGSFIFRVVPVSFILATAKPPEPLFFCTSPDTPAAFAAPPPEAGKVCACQLVPSYQKEAFVVLFAAP